MASMMLACCLRVYSVLLAVTSPPISPSGDSKCLMFVNVSPAKVCLAGER